MTQVETLVRTMLQERGVPASDEEIGALVTAYPAFKERLQSLYAVTATDDQNHKQGATIECQP